MAGATHAAFQAAPREHRWTRTLPELGRWLTREIQDAPGWGWYVLRGGACVALRVVPGSTRRELRISRGEVPRGEDGPAKFAAECRIFLKEFGWEHWASIPITEEVQGIAALFREPEGTRVCASCGAGLDENARLYGDGETCSTCAARAKAAGAKRRVVCARCRDPDDLVEIECYHDPEQSYHTKCGIQTSQEEAAARRAAREAAAAGG